MYTDAAEKIKYQKRVRLYCDENSMYQSRGHPDSIEWYP